MILLWYTHTYTQLGFHGKIFAGRGASGVTTLRRHKKLPPHQAKPVPAASRTDLLVVRAETINDLGSTHLNIYLRKCKKCCATATEEKSENTWKKHPYRHEGQGKRTGRRRSRWWTEIPLQPMLNTRAKLTVSCSLWSFMMEQISTLQLMADYTLEQMPEEDCDSMDNVCWNRLLTGPVALWTGSHAAILFLTGLVMLIGIPFWIR